MLYVTIDNAFQLREMFQEFDRDNYSWETYKGLFDYFEEIGEPEKLDVIGLCGDVYEETEKDIRKTYDIPEDVETEDFLNENTFVIASFANDNNEKCFSYFVF